MKLIYQKPEICILSSFTSLCILEGTTTRYLGGGPQEEGVPEVIGSTDGSTSPFTDSNGDGKGQNGISTRGNTGLWDEY